jgi:hypothetical protein
MEPSLLQKKNHVNGVAFIGKGCRGTLLYDLETFFGVCSST